MQEQIKICEREIRFQLYEGIAAGTAVRSVLVFSSAREGTPSGVIGRPFCIGVGSNPLREGGRGEGALEEVADCSEAVAELRGIGVGSSSTKLADVECMVAGTS